MLIVKDGISRNIDDCRLQEYKDKGYKESPDKPKEPKEPKEDQNKKLGEEK